MRKIKLISSKKGYEVNVTKVVVTNVLGSDGKIDKIPNILFDKDPRGNWIFVDTGKGYSEYTLTETEECVNTTPTVVDKEIARRSPGIDKFYGEIQSYVTLEEALVAFLKENKGSIIARDFAVVCDSTVIDVIKVLIEAGWPLDRIENYAQYEHLINPKIQAELEKELEETKAKLAQAKEAVAEAEKPITARQKAAAAKVEKEVVEAK